jgi:hypothetical protein
MTNTDQLEMKTFFESWSVGSRELLAAMLSVGTVWFLSAVWPKSLRGLWSVVVPFTFAYSLYWLPVWLGSDPSQYRAWSLIGIGTYFLSGFSSAARWSSFCESAAIRAALRVANVRPSCFFAQKRQSDVRRFASPQCPVSWVVSMGRRNTHRRPHSLRTKLKALVRPDQPKRRQG